MTLTKYATLVFDCDGVILDSNNVKTEAFRETALPYGEEVADALVAYHVANGGISRFRKFEWFISHVHAQSGNRLALAPLLAEFGSRVRAGLASCSIAPGLEELRNRTAQARWMVVSGGDQAELRAVFKERGLAELFNGGIFGSPATKEEILDSRIESGELRWPALFIGDSKYDFQSAQPRGLDFIFLRGWSEVDGMEEFISGNHLHAAENLSELLEWS